MHVVITGVDVHLSVEYVLSSEVIDYKEGNYKDGNNKNSDFKFFTEFHVIQFKFNLSGGISSLSLCLRSL